MQNLTLTVMTYDTKSNFLVFQFWFTRFTSKNANVFMFLHVMSPVNKDFS